LARLDSVWETSRLTHTLTHPIRQVGERLELTDEQKKLVDACEKSAVDVPRAAWVSSVIAEQMGVALDDVNYARWEECIGRSWQRLRDAERNSLKPTAMVSDRVCELKSEN
jgi:DNA topoisomerase VI subunit B